MMDDRELLEMAAKAAGYSVRCVGDGTLGGSVVFYMEPSQLYWNPLADDGDALRLAVSLGFVVDCSQPSASLPFVRHAFARAEIGSDPHSATRRAIVTAAAGVGRAMP